MSDEMAYGALQALRRARLRAGSDRSRGEIAIVGFDGHDLAATFDLSTVSQPVRALGRVAAEQLMSQVHGVHAAVDGSPPAADHRSPPQEQTLPTTLVIRGSSDATHSVTEP
jgi:DNA-binding LacI/PurR family transcriptional regulator